MKEFLIYATDYANELHQIENTMHQIAINAVGAMRVLLGAPNESVNRGKYAQEVAKYPAYMKDFLFDCFDERIFWNYAKSWSVDKWVETIHQLKEGEKNEFSQR